MRKKASGLMITTILKLLSFIGLIINMPVYGQFLQMATEINKEELKKLQEQKVVRAIRLNESINLDGCLEENIWKKNEPISDFRQKDPIDGAPASEKTEVWVAYDESHLYVAAFCHDSNPSGIIGLLGRRDSLVDSDWFFVAIDPYFDRRTGYFFGVNPSGSMVDQALYNDVDEDPSWDGIWEAKVARVPEGWTVEMKIPFNQLRFAKKDKYVWGINFQRTIKRKQEKVAFAWVPKEEIAYVSRFARLEGLENINPGRRLELFPYSVGQAIFRPAEPGNPFETGQKYLSNLGFDLKIGLKSNLNLDVAVNPDFGQVEVDPAVINLTAFETYYEEKRPFFIEGASMFNHFGRGGIYFNAEVNWPSPRFFYSRRIGRTPQGYPIHEGYVDFPDRTTILSAFKLTGRIGSGWNLGLISAFTGRERAIVDDLTNRYQDEVEPLTSYGVARLLKDINGGQQGLGFMATAVLRDLANETLSTLLAKRAFSLAADGWSFLDKKRKWVISGWAGGTFIEGSQAAIYRLQQSSLHYFQRPDAPHLSLNPEATKLNGWAGQFKLAKQQGNHLLLLTVGALSPGFNPNDLGFQKSSSDLIDFLALYGYQWTKPGKIFRQTMLIGGYSSQYDFGQNKIFEIYGFSFNGVLSNWWNFEYTAFFKSRTFDKNLTRGGPLAISPEGYFLNLVLGSDSRKPLVWQGNFSHQKVQQNETQWMADFSLRWKPRSNLSLSLGPTIGFILNETQWVKRVTDPLMLETFGKRYIFGRINQKILAIEIRINWIFTPRLSLQTYLQPFMAVGQYDRFKQLNRPRAYDYLIFGEKGSIIEDKGDFYLVDPDGIGPAAAFTISKPDFNYKSLRGTVVMRWEYKPGSLLYLVWTQNRADFSNPGQLAFWRDLGDLFTAPGDNIFLIKLTYRFEL
ncbi:MAG: carbohydrate binding family 9 domain-containing protein [Candidatus Aminicenantes bacterium]|nr:carbohydrate binding family 9 domain-containing protein [Candidatus Aminicenantes bacterium]